MGVTLAFDGTTVNLPWGPEWGSVQSGLDQPLTWEQMTDGRWRVWDRARGAITRDIWSATCLWRIPAEDAASLRSLVDDLARGQSAILTDSDGVLPFGPLVDCSAGLSVRATATQPQAMIAVSRDWTIQLSLVVDPHPSTQNAWLAPPNGYSLADFTAIASATPTKESSWGARATETGWAIRSRTGDGLTASLRAMLPTAKFSAALYALQGLRGGILTIPGERYPWGPGIEPNANGSHKARIKAFSWSRVAPDLWDLSATVVQEPA